MAAASLDLVKQADSLIADHLRVTALPHEARDPAGLSSLGYEVTEGMATAWVERPA